ncbi:MAG TPA: hypothetical protein VNJ01_15680 [Bacteriovoracaceae bacterium]|nr:hypothetical protein [Bacteriovoracaceae bacterium]
MKLQGLTLHTRHFQEYLSFLTEVLDLEVLEMDAGSMKLDLEGAWLEIRASQLVPAIPEGKLEFSLGSEEFQALIHKFNFYAYRKLPGHFILLSFDTKLFEMSDPDGRTWSISPAR